MFRDRRRLRLLFSFLLAVLSVAALGAAALAQYELPRENPFAPAGGQDVVVFSGGVGQVVAMVFNWAMRWLIGPYLLVLGAWRIIELIRSALSGDGVGTKVRHAATDILWVIGGLLIVLLGMSGAWYTILQTVWSSVSEVLQRMGTR